MAEPFLGDLDAVKNAVYGLLNISSDDDAFTEFADTAAEQIEDLVQYAVWAAQEWIINHAQPNWWIKQTGSLSWTGSDASNGGRYSALPSDFLKLYGEDDRSALRQPNGNRWGRQIDPESRFDARGRYFYVLDDALWITRGADPPSNLIAEYNYRYAQISASALDMSDFPVRWRPLIVAEAGVIARDYSWYPGTPENDAKMERNRKEWRDRIAVNARTSRQPRKIRSKPVAGHKWFV